MLTPERVSLQYDIAGIGSRAAAALIDSVLQYALLLVGVLAIAGAAAVVHAFGDAPDVVDTLFIALFVLLYFIVITGYFIVFEILWSGQTPGKRIVGVRVLRENGYPIRPLDSVIRNLLRIVDGLPFGYAVGVLTMLTNTRARRLGDFAAGTIVVREGAPSLLQATTADMAQPTPGLVLRTDDATLVRDFLLRRASMATDARSDLATRLANALAARYGLAFETDPEVFLEGLAG